VALAGFAACWFIPRTGAADPALTIDPNPVRETWRNFEAIRANPVVYRSILGISWFWLYGALFLSQFPDFAKNVLHGGESSVTALLAIFSVGVGLGSLACERLSGRKVEIGLVPFGSIGMTVFAVDLWLASRGTEPNLVRVTADLFLVAMFGGFFSVPLYSVIQSCAEPTHRARIIAANN